MNFYLFWIIFAFTARFSPDDKYSRQRVTVKRRFGLLPTQQPAKELWAILRCIQFGSQSIYTRNRLRDHKYSRQRVTVKRRFGLLPTQQPAKELWATLRCIQFGITNPFTLASYAYHVFSNFSVSVFALLTHDTKCDSIQFKYFSARKMDSRELICLSLHAGTHTTVFPCSCPIDVVGWK